MRSSPRLTAERIRDKTAASKRNGLWMGGNASFGYEADEMTPRVREEDAASVRRLHALHEELGTVRAVKQKAERLNLRTRLRTSPTAPPPAGMSSTWGQSHHILSNLLYAGRIRHGDPPNAEDDRTRHYRA